jgi:uncharacterized protein YraI
MNTNRLWIGSVVLGLSLVVPGALGAETATVRVDKVNVRGNPSTAGEILTRLNKGETVVILEEVDAVKPKKGEPKKWAKIQLPANSTVWVFAPYIEPSDKVVSANRLNLRGGPGESFSILGRIERGTPVREIRVTDNWMEIEAPTTAYAFVALDYLEKPLPPPPTTPTVAALPPTAAPDAKPPTPPPPTVQTVTTEPAPATTQVPKPEPTTPAVVTPPPPTEPAKPVAAAQPEPPSTATPGKPLRRTVTREGIMIYARSIQSPTKFALESLDTHRTINFLGTEQVGLTLKTYAGKKVLVTGEELLDVRWKQIPILDVEQIELVP